MSKIDDGGPASKATLRDLFAAVALHASRQDRRNRNENFLLDAFSNGTDETYEELLTECRRSESESAYALADAMLAARKTGGAA